MTKRYAVLNFSGNVGKSTIANFLVLPRMSNAVHIAIETINSDTGLSTAAIQLRGKEVETVQQELLLSDELVVDIGASNIEAFLKEMALFDGSIHDFDTFLIPVTPEKKQQIDTISTVTALLEMGISPKKLKVIYNRVEADSDVEQVFSGLRAFLKSEKIAVLNSYIPDSPFFEKANDLGLTVEDILADETDYRSLIRAEPDHEKRLQLTAKVMLPRLATAIKMRLDEVAKDVL